MLVMVTAMMARLRDGHTRPGRSAPTPDRATRGLSNSSYFGIDAVTGNLYSIDTTAGATTLLGSTTAAVLPAGCTLESSLSSSATLLYYTIGYSGTGCTSPMSDTLYQIDPTSGTTTNAVQLTIGGSGCMLLLVRRRLATRCMDLLPLERSIP